MEKIVERGLLFDIYGELLTERQKDVYRELVEGDMSLSELSEEFGISRQGVHDIVKRCDALLYGYEEKLGLMARFLDMRNNIYKARQIIVDGKLCEMSDKVSIIDDILKELAEKL